MPKSPPYLVLHLERHLQQLLHEEQHVEAAADAGGVGHIVVGVRVEAQSLRTEKVRRFPARWASSSSVPNLRDELQHGVGEERPDGEADEVGQHFGEIGLLGEGDEEEAEQRRQVDQRDRQEAVTPNWRDKTAEQQWAELRGVCVSRGGEFRQREDEEIWNGE